MNLLHTAKQLVEIYKQNTKVEAILLAGSVSRGWEDEHSDIELHILWSSPPDEDDRMQPITQCEGTLLSFHPYEEEEWSEAYLTKEGVKVEISSFLTESVERFISEVVEQHNTDYDLQCVVASVHYGIGLYGENKIDELKSSVSFYPIELAEKMMEENLWLGNRWNNRRALLKREDWLMLTDVLCDVQKKLLGVLFGLNHMYVHHPAFKWMSKSIDLMWIKPPFLKQRLEITLQGSPTLLLEEVENLVLDVILLVEENAPDLDISEQKKNISYTK